MTVPFRPVPETGPDLGAVVNANSRASGVDTKRGITAGAVVTINEGAHVRAATRGVWNEE
jgi:hypothetical protein